MGGRYVVRDARHRVRLEYSENTAVSAYCAWFLVSNLLFPAVPLNAWDLVIDLPFALSCIAMFLWSCWLFPTAWFGPVQLVVDRSGIGIPKRVLWRDIVGIGVGTCDRMPDVPSDSPSRLVTEFEPHRIRPTPVDELPTTGALALITLAVRAHCPTQTRQFAAHLSTLVDHAASARSRGNDAYAAGLESLTERLQRWQWTWSAAPQPVGYWRVLDDSSLDLTAFIRAVRRARPDLLVGPLPPGAMETPHSVAALLVADAANHAFIYA